MPSSGTRNVSATDSTPGIARRPAISSRFMAAAASGGGAGAGRLASTMRTRSLRKPSSSPSRLAKLRANRNAATTRTSDTATCATTSARRNRRPPASPATERPPLFSASPGLPRDARTAGARPRITQVPNAGEREERDDAPVRRQRQHDRVAGGGDQLHEPLAQDERHQRAGDRAGRGDDDALGQELRQEPAPRGAQRQTQRELALPHGAARQHQRREVRAGDEQHEAGHAEQQPQRRPVLLAQIRCGRSPPAWPSASNAS